MPNYSVKLGLGLHVGWAIEGAIGSFYKIDASYLSPNVNKSAQLEGSTKAFGVPLLISGELIAQMTPRCKNHMRRIDVIEGLVPGTKQCKNTYERLNLLKSFGLAM